MLLLGARNDDIGKSSDVNVKREAEEPGGGGGDDKSSSCNGDAMNVVIEAADVRRESSWARSASIVLNVPPVGRFEQLMDDDGDVGGDGTGVGVCVSQAIICGRGREKNVHSTKYTIRKMSTPQ